MKDINRIQHLVKELNEYRHAYYNLSQPIVSDQVYDRLFDELDKLERQTGFVLSNSPTLSVGYEVISKLQKVTHKTPLKSLDKTKEIDEINAWRKLQDYLLMLKGDGLTIELDYENGFLVEASTRGNGEVGEIVTHNARTFKNIPLQIPFKGVLRIAGEAVIHWNDFNEINSKLSEEEKYATPRNLVAGSVRQLDSEICAERNVHFYAFNILEASDQIDGHSHLADSKYSNFKWIASYGFWTIPHKSISNQMSQKDIYTMTECANHLNMPIDGLVATFDSINYSNSLGETSHHPLHSMAFKFEDEMEETILREVEWNTTRSGHINPTAIFDTVILDNTEVSRASLFNLTFIREKCLNLGCNLLISKRNMIIPYVEENLNKTLGMLKIPNECPSCGDSTSIKNTGTADYLYCDNPNCTAKKIDKFVHFVSRNAMNIDGFSEAGIELFIQKGFIQYFDDIYSLENYKSDILKLEGWGERSYAQLINSIDKSRKVKCANLIYALGIPNIGSSSSKTIAKYFKNNFQDFINACSINFDFSKLDDFGSVTSESLHQWYKTLDERRMWIYLMEEIEIIQEEQKEVVNTKNPFNGKKVYATGSFANYKKEEIKSLLESLGAEFASGYAKSLDYLIVGSLKGSSKEDKAKIDGVQILGELEFNKIIER